MKILFDIKYKQQIESGKYKVVTKSNIPVRIICWNAKAYNRIDIIGLTEGSTGCENVQRYDSNGHLIADSARKGDKDLCILTSEGNLAEFEEALNNIISVYDETNDIGNNYYDFLNRASEQLVAIANKQIIDSIPQWKTIEEVTTKRTDENDCVTTEPLLVKGWMNDDDFRLIEPDCMVNRKMLCIPVKEIWNKLRNI